MDVNLDRFHVDCLIILLSILNTNSFDYRLFNMLELDGKEKMQSSLAATEFGELFFGVVDLLPDLFTDLSQCLKNELCDFFDGRLFTLICFVRSTVVTLGFPTEVEVHYNRIWNIVEKYSAGVRRLFVRTRRQVEGNSSVFLLDDEIVGENEENSFKLDVRCELLSILQDGYRSVNSANTRNMTNDAPLASTTTSESTSPKLISVSTPPSNSVTNDSDDVLDDWEDYDVSESPAPSPVLEQGRDEVLVQEIRYEPRWHWHNHTLLEDFLWARGVKVRTSVLSLLRLLTY
jgi:hypothetical protein